jgi:hypothetical protein
MHGLEVFKSDVHQSFRKGGQRAAPKWPGDDKLLQLGKEVSKTGCRLAGQHQGCDGWPVSRQQRSPAVGKFVQFEDPQG